MSLQLLIVGIALFIESLELGDAESCFCEPLGVVFCPLPDGGGKPKGCGANGGIEHWVKSKDCLS